MPVRIVGVHKVPDHPEHRADSGMHVVDRLPSQRRFAELKPQNWISTWQQGMATYPGRDRIGNDDGDLREIGHARKKESVLRERCPA